MFSTLMEWSRIAITAFSAMFDFLSQTLEEMVEGTGIEWLFDIVDTIAGWITNLPILGALGANLWEWVTTTPIIETIIAYIPLVMVYSFISWIIDIAP